MPKLQVTKELINSIANQDNKKFVKNVNKRVNESLALAIDNLSNKVSYINLKNVTLQPVNELLTDSFIDNSNCVYFLGIENAQLEMNTTRKMNIWRNLKERLKFAWENRKLFNKRRRKKRRRKKVETADNLENKVKFDPSKYSIYDLAEDMQYSICNYLIDTTVVTLVDNSLQIVGKEDFGSNTSIIVYLVNMTENKFKYYAGRKKGFIEIDINKRINAINNKINEIGENFIKMLKIFNSLFYNVNGYMPNQIFLESILINCPNDLFDKDDLYKAYIKIINYLSLTTIRNIKSLNDENKTINEDIVCGNCGIAFNKMLSALK